MQKDEQTPVLLIGTEKTTFTPVSLRIEAHLVYLTAAQEVRNYTDGWTGDNRYADLMVAARVDQEGAAYGFHVEYHRPYAVRLERAEAMVKTLRKVEKGLDKWESEMGYVNSFATYLIRVAKVLGIQQVGWKTARSSGMLYADDTYYWTGPTGMQSHIENLIHEFQKEKVNA